jgi:hypothetical protein
MTLEPALLAVMLADALALLALAVTAVTAARVELGWNPDEATSRQLELERRIEEMSALGRVGIGLHAGATLLLGIAINQVLPRIVPGAMCGVGVLQAMPGGIVALALRGASVTLLVVWATLDRLDRSTTLGELARPSARAMLVAFPVAAVAAYRTLLALQVDVHAPVSCCAAVYDLASTADSHVGLAAAGTAHVLATVLGAVGLTVLGWRVRRAAVAADLSLWLPTASIVLGWAWAAIAAWTLVDVAGPYLYGVLGHRCPLCLFVPHHFGVGYLVYGALAWVMLEGAAMWAAAAAARTAGEVTCEALARVQRAARRMSLASWVFVTVAFTPALLWRLRFGVWIGGGPP